MTLKKILFVIISLFIAFFWLQNFTEAKWVVDKSRETINTVSDPELMKKVFNGMIWKVNVEVKNVLTINRIGLQWYFWFVYILWFLELSNGDVLAFATANEGYNSQNYLRAFLKDAYDEGEVFTEWSFYFHRIKNQKLKSFIQKIKDFSALPWKNFVYKTIDNERYFIDHELSSWEKIIKKKELLIKKKDLITRINREGDFCWLINNNIKCKDFSYPSFPHNNPSLPDATKLLNSWIFNKGYLNFFIQDNYIILHNLDKTISIFEINFSHIPFWDNTYWLPLHTSIANNLNYTPFILDKEIICEGNSCNSKYNINIEGYKIKETHIKDEFYDIGFVFPSFNDNDLYSIIKKNNEYYMATFWRQGSVLIKKLNLSPIDTFKKYYSVPYFDKDGDLYFFNTHTQYSYIFNNVFPTYNYFYSYAKIFSSNTTDILFTGDDITYIKNNLIIIPENYIHMIKTPKNSKTFDRLMPKKLQPDEEPIWWYADFIWSYNFWYANGLQFWYNSYIKYNQNSYYFYFNGSNYSFNIQNLQQKIYWNLSWWDVRRNCDLQGSYGWGCPIQNACKILSDSKSIDDFWLLTGKCPGGKEVLPWEIGFKTDSNPQWHLQCVDVVDDDAVKKVKPIIETNVEGKCSATNCTWVEPWYVANKLNEVRLKTTVRPQNFHIKWRPYNWKLFLDTLSVYVNWIKLSSNSFDNQIIPIPASAPLNWVTENPFTFMIKLNGTWGVNGDRWINYINIEICDYVLDNNYNAVSADKKYLLNCTTESIVVKLDPSDDNEANDWFTLNQSIKSCLDFWIQLTEGSEWVFPVQSDGTYIESCNKEWTNCVPKAKNVCNFQCAKWYIKDWNKCILEEKQFNCNDKLGALLPNEERYNPPTVNPEHWTFMSQYKTLYHTYIPTLDYCQKKCKVGFQRDTNGTCSPLRQERVCGKVDWANDTSRALKHFERFTNDTTELIDPNTKLPLEWKTLLPFQQFWEDKPDNTWYFDSLLDVNKEYLPPKAQYCAIEVIPWIVQSNGENVCPIWHTWIDLNGDWIIGTCISNTLKLKDVVENPPIWKEEDTICFHTYLNPNADENENLYNNYVNSHFTLPIRWYQFVKNEETEVKYHPYKWSAWSIPICVKNPPRP